MDTYVRMQDWDSVAFMKDIAGGSYIVVHSMLYIGVTICIYVATNEVLCLSAGRFVYRLNNL